MKREHLWPLGMVMILLGTVVINFWMIHVAGDDPSFAIEPNYYARAVAWDSTVAQEARNRRLGWSIEPTLTAFDETGAVLSVALTDSAGGAIPDARVSVSALFVGRANEVLDAPLAPVGSRYAARLPVRHRGAWELRFTVNRGGERFTSTHRVEVRTAPASGT